MEIGSKAHCKTHHVDRKWNFNPEMTRNSRKGSPISLPEMYPGFQKLCPVVVG